LAVIFPRYWERIFLNQIRDLAKIEGGKKVKNLTIFATPLNLGGGKNFLFFWKAHIFLHIGSMKFLT